MLAGAFVDISMSPRIIRDITLEVRAFPALRITRLLHEIEQTVLAFGIETVVHLKGVESGTEGGDLGLGGGLASLLGASGELRDDDGGQDAEDHQDQEEFDQRESARGLA